ncbi:clustered mitochondria protein 1 [Trichomonascus vanleenenianus]|uniref:translation initiation factor 3 subunit CLU1 n=1 Tax=Trichomonascus vanleenenianus TaxID=2268995 RepID=UPI003ECA0D9C
MSDQEKVQDDMVTIVVQIPSGQKQEVKVKIAKTDLLNEVRQYLVDAVSPLQPYTCFSLWREGDAAPLDRFSPVGELGLSGEVVVKLVPEAYNESESKLHIVKVRDILGFESESVRSLPALDVGLSLFEPVSQLVAEAAANQEPEEELNTEGMSEEEVSKAQAERLANRKTVLDHPMAESADQGAVSLPDLLPVKLNAPSPAVRSLQLSQWNPVPPALKMRGHLMYLQASTWEGKTYHITSTTSGFHVSNSSGERFDPHPKSASGKAQRHHSLIALLESLSPLITTHLDKIATYVKQSEPVNIINPSNTYLASPWVVDKQSALEKAHSPDLSRTQEALFNPNRADGTMLRDWNEEYQSIREMPKVDAEGNTSISDRIMRERLLNKLSFEFADSAVKGAMAVIHGDIPALNPNEPEPARIFLYNNMFFSFGADGIGSFEAEGGDSAARAAAGKDLAGVNYVNQLDVDGLCQLCTTVVDFGGRRVVCQGPVPGIFRESQTTTQTYGSVDNRESIVRDEEFEPLMKKIADALRLKTHEVYDASGENPQSLVSPMDAKGLKGSDGRNYVLDLYRLSPTDIEFNDKYCNDETAPYPHKMGVLRMEAIDDWFRSQAREYLANKKKDDSKEEKTTEQLEAERAEQESDLKMLAEKHRLNPDVGIDIATLPESAHAQFKQDQDEVREVCKYVTEIIIPKFVEDIKEGILTTALSGSQLTSVFHRKGINMRYIGVVYNLAKEKGAPLEALCRLLIREAVSRATKHVINALVRDLPLQLAPYLGVYVFNSLLAPGVEPGLQIPEELQELYPQAMAEIKSFGLTTDSVNQLVAGQVLARFRFTLPDNWLEQALYIPLFREMSLKNGFQWKAKPYEFGGSRNPLLAADDLANVVPLVKYSTFRSQIAEDALEAGRLSILKNETDVGIEFLYESLGLHEQIYGVLHPSTAHAYGQAAAAYHEMKDYANACELARKSVFIYERVSGVDSNETLYTLLNLAWFENGKGNTVGALEIIKYAYKLWQVVSGPDHPDTLSTIINVCTMLQHLKDYKMTAVWFGKAIELARQIYGGDSITEAQLQYQLSQNYTLAQHFDEAVAATKEAHRIFEAQLGAEHENTVESKKWLDTLEPVAAQVAKARQQQQSATTQQAAALAQAQAQTRQRHTALGQQGAASEPRNSANTSAVLRRRADLADKSIEEVMNYINGKAPSSKSKKKKSKKGKKL